MSKMDDLDDIPDLDDMSDMVAGIKLNQQGNNVAIATAVDSSSNTKKVHEHSDNSISKSQNVKKVNDGRITKPESQFGGMKKGFLFGTAKASSKSSRSVSKPSRYEEIISPKNNSQQNSLVLDEVQEAMKQNVVSDKSWLTEDLLSQINSNEKLSKQLMDPRISKAVSWMQKDPKAATDHYKDDIEVQDFFKDFYGILGNHFTNISEKQDATSETAENMKPDLEDEEAMKRILSDSTIKQILLKPSIQKLLQELRTNPDEAQKTLNMSDQSFKDDVNKLVTAGVLAFQSG